MNLGKERGCITSLGLVLAALAIVIPILWERLANSTSLQLEHLSTTTLVERSPELTKLRILYDGQETQAVSRITFALVNSGYQPIKAQDVTKYPHVVFVGDGRLLESSVESLSPSNLDCTLAIDADGSGVIVAFPLLNAGDRLQFSVLYSGRLTGHEADARIAKLPEIVRIDRAQELARPKSSAPWTVYPAAVVLLLLLASTISISKSWFEERKAREAFRNEANALPRFTTIQEYHSFVDLAFSFATVNRRQGIKQSVSAIAGSGPITQETQDAISNVVRMESFKSDGNVGAAIIAVFLMAGAAAYIVSQVSY